MKRSGVVSWTVLWSLAAGVLVAQSPQPTGMLSPSRPVLFTNDGTPDGTGDLAATIQRGLPAVQTPVSINFGTQCNGATSFGVLASASQTGGTLDQFSRTQAPEVQIEEYDNTDVPQPRPIGAEFNELGGAGPASGAMTMADTDADHRYERMQIVGSASFGPVQAELDLVPADTNDDGDPDYVTLSSLEPLAFFGLNCDVNGTPTDFTQIWMPLARDLDGDFAIVADLDGNGEADPEFAWGPKLDLGGNGPSILAVPTLSSVSLAAFTLLLLGFGLRFLRRRGPAASA